MNNYSTAYNLYFYIRTHFLHNYINYIYIYIYIIRFYILRWHAYVEIYINYIHALNLSMLNSAHCIYAVLKGNSSTNFSFHFGSFRAPYYYQWLLFEGDHYFLEPLLHYIHTHNYNLGCYVTIQIKLNSLPYSHTDV